MGKVAYTRYDEMYDDYVEYDAAHPEVWDHFVTFTMEQIKRGFTRYSVNAIFERIRWTVDIPDRRGQSTFKISNNHRPFYARRFLEEYPEHGEFFVIHEQSSKTKPPIKGASVLW